MLLRQQMRNAAILEQELSISKRNAQMIKDEYEQEKSKPAKTFYLQAPSVLAAANQIAKRIESKDPTLPEAALENTN
jgi:hypothetical protein